MSRRLPGNDATPVGVFTPYPTETADDETRDQTHPAGTRGQPEPQGPRQRARDSSRHHQGPSRRRETEHPRAGRSREYGAEYEQPAERVRSGRHSGARFNITSKAY